MSAAPRRTPRAFNWPCLVAVTLLLAAPWAQAMLDDTERHPLESEALAHPDQVLAQLPPLLEAARQRGDQRELALLELAHANACRVVANWDCQRDAGRAAQLAADEAGEPLLAIRALIAESRGLMAKQDYSPGGQLLAEAERRLRRTPSPALMADVQLGYSSMSNFLERHELARTYADRGLQVLGEIAEPLIRARLLRNRGRAEARLGQVEAARASLREAIDVAVAVKDPKLSAELDLELARIARDQGDVATQRASAQRVLALAEQFGHAQLRALGHEVLGEVALEAKQLAEAEQSFQLSRSQFHLAGLDAEERRVLRALIRVKLMRLPNRSDLGPDLQRLLELDDVVDRRDRALVGEDLDARLRYAEQEFQLQRLAKESELAAEREKSLQTSNRLRLLMAGAAVAGLLVIAVFLQLSRRATARLAAAYDRLQRSDAALDASEKRLRSVTDNIPAIISHVDRNERYTFSNAYMHRLTGVNEADIIGRSVREVRGDTLYATLAPNMQRALAGEAVSFEGQAELAGRIFHYQTSYIPERDADGEVCGFFALTFDITRMKLAEAQLEREARFDTLTGVANRRHFEERLALAVARGRHQPTALAVLYLDIDYLKQINDRHGHAVGDVVIREFATRLVGCVRDSDLVARIGGDEFVVLTEHVEATLASDAAERTALAVIAAMVAPVTLEGMTLRISTSIGIAVTQSLNNADALIADADRALYAAKAAGRNTWRRAESSH
ncbi:MAG: GGDEF domain-containing protein [Rhodanobacteraceae bacterium]|nr:GGDEF domain-containing protein [Rhodanobacteraceae bacterium]MBL0040361.1 GGDEF domain-containing protein [Xanthomonadales bacterium]MBP6078630.1 GGDEF domain-containing protein [Xanthomonadales bacterium]MBP7623015.1 GGDEF domain-containing protein [Xanthomonadales bacterium]